MSHSMFLPHEILGSLFESGKLERLACGDPLLKVALNYILPSSLRFGKSEKKGQGSWAAKALKDFWTIDAGTDWFRSHPLLSEPRSTYKAVPASWEKHGMLVAHFRSPHLSQVFNLKDSAFSCAVYTLPEELV